MILLTPTDLSDGCKILTEEDTCPGVYMALCVVSGLAYVGSSANLYNRVGEHEECLLKGVHGNPHWQNIVNKRGINTFLWFVLQKVNSNERSVRVILEGDWYDKCLPEHWLNCGRPTMGCPMTPEIRGKIAQSVSVASTLLWKRPGIRKRHHDALVLAFSDPVVKKRVSDAIRASKNIPENKAKISETNKEIANRPSVKSAASARMIVARSDQNARINSQESRNLLSVAISRAWQDPDYREEQSEAFKRAWSTKKTRQRHEATMLRGEERQSAKLNDEAVREIRREHDRVKIGGGVMGEVYLNLSIRYGVHASLIQMVAKRKRWKHVK